MKFTKEQLTEALKAKLTANGKKLSMSERTLKSNVERIYARLERTNDETLELDAAVADYLPDFEEIEGNMRKDNADFVKEWEKQHPKPKEESKPKDEPTTESEQLKALQRQLQTLLDKQEAAEKAKTLSDYKSDISSQLSEKLKEFSNSKGWIERRLKGYAFNTETDKEEVVKSLVADFNADFAGVKPNITPNHAGGGGENKDPELAKIRKMREEQIKREQQGN